jgi:hypothetical protein
MSGIGAEQVLERVNLSERIQGLAERVTKKDDPF